MVSDRSNDFEGLLRRLTEDKKKPEGWSLRGWGCVSERDDESQPSDPTVSLTFRCSFKYEYEVCAEGLSRTSFDEHTTLFQKSLSGTSLSFYSDVYGSAAVPIQAGVLLGLQAGNISEVLRRRWFDFEPERYCQLMDMKVPELRGIHSPEMGAKSRKDKKTLVYDILAWENRNRSDIPPFVSEFSSYGMSLYTDDADMSKLLECLHKAVLGGDVSFSFDHMDGNLLTMSVPKVVLQDFFNDLVG